ncbi:MAG: molybdenum transporter ATP-binding protein, partial [Friedmanniella sp.]|nr:molybdenum transporter ATP-binding protein [Friedmanniella sp.]
MTLQVQVQVRSRQLDVAFELEPGERVAVVGPNGSGKSSLLAVLAGLVRPDRGHLELDGRVLFHRSDPAVGGVRPPPAQWVPPYARNVALLAQDPLLFPHLNVLQNVAFAPRAAGRSRAEARGLALEWLKQVGAESLATRRVGQLSGGQAQRVAIARALAARPRLMLLDEPMAALDVTSAPLLRRVLREVLQGQSLVIVTHDLLDALLLADRVIVLDHGRVVESGPLAEVVAHP